MNYIHLTVMLRQVFNIHGIQILILPRIESFFHRSHMVMMLAQRLIYLACNYLLMLNYKLLKQIVIKTTHSPSRISYLLKIRFMKSFQEIFSFYRIWDLLDSITNS